MLCGYHGVGPLSSRKLCVSVLPTVGTGQSVSAASSCCLPSLTGSASSSSPSSFSPAYPSASVASARSSAFHSSDVAVELSFVFTRQVLSLFWVSTRPSVDFLWNSSSVFSSYIHQKDTFPKLLSFPIIFTIKSLCKASIFCPYFHHKVPFAKLFPPYFYHKVPFPKLLAFPLIFTI